METILVTGASGLIGKAIINKLANDKNYNIYAVISGRRKVHFPANVNVLIVNLSKIDEIEEVFNKIKPQICFHYAWSTIAQTTKISNENILWLEISLHILQAFIKNGGNRFIFAGSYTEYGSNYYGNQEYPHEPLLTMYGQAKKAFEETAKVFCENNQIDFLSARYFTVYGPGDDKDTAIAMAIKAFLKKEKFICKTPENIWDYIYIDDCVGATLALFNNRCNGTYNIGSGQPVYIKNIFITIAKYLNALNLLSFANNSKTVIEIADISKLKKDTNYEFSTSLEDGIKKNNSMVEG